jgi:NAD(P)-dependent dehydrogenase (short-subunit alcohol dehydrogenase family)
MNQNGTYCNFADKVAIVTGGSTGIGRATALLFARRGAKVVIGDVNPERRETVEAIQREGSAAFFVETDVRNAQQVEYLVAAAVKTYGGLHCAFNNAGILPAKEIKP